MNTTQKLIMYAVLSIGMFFLAREVAFQSYYKEQAERAASAAWLRSIDSASSVGGKFRAYDAGAPPVDYEPAYGNSRNVALGFVAVLWLTAIPSFASKKEDDANIPQNQS